MCTDGLAILALSLSDLAVVSRRLDCFWFAFFVFVISGCLAFFCLEFGILLLLLLLVPFFLLVTRKLGAFVFYTPPFLVFWAQEERKFEQSSGK